MRCPGCWLGLALVLASSCAPSAAGKAVPRSAGGEARAPAGIATTASAAPDGGGASPVRIGFVIKARPTDPATAGFADVVRQTLTDPRGWQAAGFRFVFGDDAPYRIVLAEGPEVERLCRPYDVYGRFSCQNGPVVALNADRWRSASPEWTGDLDTYRRMLVNHEVGHLLGQHHPAVRCPQRGQPAPVMTQQSSELDGCLPNPWPLRWELDCAARHEEPLAPGYEVHPRSSCGPA